MTSAIRPYRPLTIGHAMTDPELFGAVFTPRASWQPWVAFCKAVFGERLRDQELAIFQACTGRMVPPPRRGTEAWAIVGRRGGKSRVAAALAIFLACFQDYRQVRATGEQPVIMLIGADRAQAGLLLNYVTPLTTIPALAPFRAR